MEFFQDDLFTPTQSAEATCTAAEWMGGASAPAKLISLRPAVGGVPSEWVVTFCSFCVALLLVLLLVCVVG
jgi:Type of WD40 repeat